MTARPAPPVPSPCVDICQMHAASGWCSGCLRTIDEVAAWSRMADADKQAVWQQLPARRVIWQQLQASGAAPTVLRPRGSR
jgi:uncharacterized protein